jgi:hypothetical protein
MQGSVWLGYNSCLLIRFWMGKLLGMAPPLLQYDSLALLMPDCAHCLDLLELQMAERVIRAKNSR